MNTVVATGSDSGISAQSVLCQRVCSSTRCKCRHRDWSVPRYVLWEDQTCYCAKQVTRPFIAKTSSMPLPSPIALSTYH